METRSSDHRKRGDWTLNQPEVNSWPRMLDRMKKAYLCASTQEEKQKHVPKIASLLCRRDCSHPALLAARLTTEALRGEPVRPVQ